jgi:hypothetical protein
MTIEIEVRTGHFRRIGRDRVVPRPPRLNLLRRIDRLTGESRGGQLGLHDTLSVPASCQHVAGDLYVQNVCYRTYMAKLTLSVDDRVISQAKKYAKSRGVSVSEMVETYLAAVVDPPHRTDSAPVLRSVRGVLKKADIEDYRKHLRTKYR